MARSKQSKREQQQASSFRFGILPGQPRLWVRDPRSRGAGADPQAAFGSGEKTATAYSPRRLSVLLLQSAAAAAALSLSRSHPLAHSLNSFPVQMKKKERKLHTVVVVAALHEEWKRSRNRMLQ